MEHFSAFVFRAHHRLGHCHSARHLGGGQKRFVGGPRLFAVSPLSGLSVPDVLLSLLALWFAAATGWFPVGGAQSPLYDFMSPAQQFWDRAHHLILPAIVLAASDLAGIMRQMRSCLLDTLRAEYVTAARARGLGEGWVI